MKIQKKKWGWGVGSWGGVGLGGGSGLWGGGGQGGCVRRIKVFVKIQKKNFLGGGVGGGAGSGGRGVGLVGWVGGLGWM